MKSNLQSVYFSKVLFTGNLAGIPLVQQLGLLDFLLLTLRDFSLTGSVLLVSEHELTDVIKINTSNKDKKIEKTEDLFILLIKKLSHTSETQITHTRVR